MWGVPPLMACMHMHTITIGLACSGTVVLLSTSSLGKPHMEKTCADT